VSTEWVVTTSSERVALNEQRQGELTFTVTNPTGRADRAVFDVVPGDGADPAWFTVDEHGDGRVALGVRADAKENEALVAADPERFGLPKYVARHGWVTYYLDLPDRPVDWDEVAELVRDSYRLQAPKRLSRLLDD